MTDRPDVGLRAHIVEILNRWEASYAPPAVCADAILALIQSSSLTPAEVREAAARIAHNYSFTPHGDPVDECPVCVVPDRIAALIRAMPLTRTAQKVAESSEGIEDAPTDSA